MADLWWWKPELQMAAMYFLLHYWNHILEGTNFKMHLTYYLFPFTKDYSQGVNLENIDTLSERS